MSSILDSRSLIRTIRRRAFIPSDQRTFTEDDFLEMATEEVNLGLMDQLMVARGDYLVDFIDLELSDSVYEYAIPSRAHGNKLRDAAIVDSNGSVVQELSQIELTDLYDIDNTTYRSSSSNTFYVRNNFIVLNYSNSTNYFIRMWFYMRPNKLVLNTRAGTISSLTATSEIDTIDAQSGSITSISISVSGVTTITSASHGLAGGETIQITGADSTPAIDGSYTVTYIDANTFSVEATVTVAGTTASWSKMVSVYSIQLDVVPTHFTTSLLYDVVGAASPNKIKQYDLTANSLNTTTKVITFRVADFSGVIAGDYITKAEETIVPNVPTEYHPIIAQRVAVSCLEAMGDEQNKQSAERKLAQMEKAALRIITNRVEGAPKKIKNRHGTLNQTRNIRSRRW